MFVEKLNAIELHKFVKENIDESVISVDIRPSLSQKEELKTAIIYSKTTQGTEANLIFYSNKKFCITYGKEQSLKLKELDAEKINVLWKSFLASKFGAEYYNFLKQNLEISK